MLTSLGVRGQALEWLKSYLTGRRQFVAIKDARSREHIKTCDVPQGSILGPNLCEDYSACPVGSIFRKHNISYHIYADDTQAYVSFTPGNEKSALDQLEKCLHEIRQWMAANWLKLNDDKTEFIIFGSKENLEHVQTKEIKISEVSVDRVASVKSIGATLDSHLTMESQVAAICKSSWFHLHQISKIKEYLTRDQLQTVIQAYVISRLDQNNSLLIGIPKYKIRKLQMLQNACARLISGTRKHDHVTPSLMQLHWLPVEQRIIFKVLLLVYKALNGKAPAYLSELLDVYTPVRTLRSSSQSLLTLPESHYVQTRMRDFSHRGPKEWNKLPSNLRECKTTDSFKRNLKTHLFRKAYL